MRWQQNRPRDRSRKQSRLYAGSGWLLSLQLQSERCLGKQKAIAATIFIDVQSRGEYPNYGLKMLAEKGITLEQTAEDTALLKAHTVDFISFFLLCLSGRCFGRFRC